jgi:hypothetical protein
VVAPIVPKRSHGDDHDDDPDDRWTFVVLVLHSQIQLLRQVAIHIQLWWNSIQCCYSVAMGSPSEATRIHSRHWCVVHGLVMLPDSKSYDDVLLMVMVLRW